MMLAALLACLIAFLPPGGLEDVPPGATRPDSVNRFPGNPVSARNFRRSVYASQRPNSPDLVFGKPSPAMTFSPGLSSLLLPISEVVGIGAEKQVLGIHAHRVVAGMKHLGARRNDSTSQQPRDAVSLFHAPVQPKVSVTLPVARAHPRQAPAWRRRANLGCEPLVEIPASTVGTAGCRRVNHITCLSITLEPSSVKRTVDGDTFILWHVGIPAEERVRVLGVDTPEIRDNLGLAAKGFTAEWLGRGPFTVYTCKRDSFGRLLAMVYRGSDTLAVSLVAAGLGTQVAA